MRNLLFYIIDSEYIKYLREFEENVSYNKGDDNHIRPYLGIVLEMGRYEYFAPLYSYKPHYDKYKNNPSFFFVYGKNNRPLSIIKFSSMIPIPKNLNVVKLQEYDKLDSKYQDLISTEYRFINKNKREIYSRAKRLYLLVTNDKKNFLKTISCKFKLLEERSLNYSTIKTF